MYTLFFWQEFFVTKVESMYRQYQWLTYKAMILFTREVIDNIEDTFKCTHLLTNKSKSISSNHVYC